MPKTPLDSPIRDAQLAKQPFLTGDSFCVGDLNVASVLTWTDLVGLDIAAHKHVVRWLETCLSRPAAKKIQGG